MSSWRQMMTPLQYCHIYFCFFLGRLRLLYPPPTPAVMWVPSAPLAIHTIHTDQELCQFQYSASRVYCNQDATVPPPPTLHTDQELCQFQYSASCVYCNQDISTSSHCVDDVCWNDNNARKIQMKTKEIHYITITKLSHNIHSIQWQYIWHFQVEKGSLCEN